MGVIGKTILRNHRVEFDDGDRLRHVYVIGQTGTGKSTLLRNLIAQDIQSGKGVGLLDPHGDLAEEILDLIPRSRTDDVIYFNPADLDSPLGFNPLQNVEPDKRSLVAQGILHSFKSIWGDSWGEGRMQYVFMNCLLALMDYPGATLLYVNRFLTDQAFRKQILRTTKNPAVLHYWRDVFPRFKEHEQAIITSPIENKVGQFTTDLMVRNILGQPQSKFDLKKVMDTGQIFIANLSKGRVGNINSNLLGSLLVSQFEMSVMARATEQERYPFFLCLDEFQNFTTDSFESILSEARKYGLSLTLAHQYIDQLPYALQRAVFGNVGTLVSLRIGNKDAEVLAAEMDKPSLSFVELSRYTALVRQLKNNDPCDVGFVSLADRIGANHGCGLNIIQQSRRRYGKDRAFVNRKIEEWYQ